MQCGNSRGHMVVRNGDVSTFMCESQDESVVRDQSVQVLSGEIQILFHPVYHVLVPYMRVWDRSGNLLDVEQVQSLIDCSTSKTTADNSEPGSQDNEMFATYEDWNAGNENRVSSNVRNSKDDKTTDISSEYDARQYEFGRLMAENHPILDTPYLTIHVCTLESKLSDIMRGQSSDELYALNWLSLVGPHIGISVDSKLYHSLAKIRMD